LWTEKELKPPAQVCETPVVHSDLLSPVVPAEAFRFHYPTSQPVKETLQGFSLNVLFTNGFLEPNEPLSLCIQYISVE